MFNNLLVLVDRQNNTVPLIRHAECMAGVMQATVTLLSASSNQPKTESSSLFVDPIDWELQNAATESYLRELVQKLADRYIQAHIRVLNNMDADNISKIAQDEQADLIIMVRETENINDVMHALMKNTRIPILSLPLNAVAHHADNAAPCYKKIMLPLDGSKRAESILPIGHYFAETFDADLIVTHIIKTVDAPWSDAISDEEARLHHQMVESNRRQAEAYFASIKSRLPENTRFHMEVSDSVRAALLHTIEAEQVDLIVLSAHGYSGEPKWAYGNIASNLIAYSSAPVLIIQDLPINEVGAWAQTVQRQTKVR